MENPGSNNNARGSLQIPEEILLIIFDFIHASDKSSTLNMMLVCKYWKHLIENYHVFDKFMFFEKSRSSQEFTIALESSRKFKSMKILWIEYNNLNANLVNQLIIKNQRTLKNISIDIQGVLDFDDFYHVLILLRDITDLSVHFVNITQIQNSNYNKPKIIFEELESLTVKWDNGLRAIHKVLLSFMIVPNLKKLNIDLPDQYGTHEAFNYFEFLNQSSSQLQKAYIWSKNYYGFNWDAECVEIWSEDVIKNEIIKFMENRKANLKTFKLHWMDDEPFVSSIFKSADTLEHFETSINHETFCGQNIYRNIKMLTLWNFRFTDEAIAAVYHSFPNLEVLRFVYVGLSAEICNSIRRVFPRLIAIQKYDSSSNSYKDVNF